MSPLPRRWDPALKKNVPEVDPLDVLLASEANAAGGAVLLEADGRIRATRLGTGTPGPSTLLAGPASGAVGEWVEGIPGGFEFGGPVSVGTATLPEHALTLAQAEDLTTSEALPWVLSGARFVWNAVDYVTLVPSGLDGLARVPVANSAGDRQSIEISTSLQFILPTHLDTGAEAANTGYDLRIVATASGAYRPLITVSGDTPVLPSGYTYQSSVLLFLSNSQGGSNLDICRFEHAPDGTVRYRTNADMQGVAVLLSGTATTATAISLGKAVPNVSGCLFHLVGVPDNNNATASSLILYQTSGGSTADRIWSETCSTSAGRRRNHQGYMLPHLLHATPATSLYYVWTVGSAGRSFDCYVWGYNLGTSWGRITSDSTGVPSVGTVSSVALSMPAEFSVAGSPITTGGTLAVTKATQTANTVYAGPTSGGAAAPAFRALTTPDISVTLQDAVTAAVTELQRLTHTTSGTAADGFGGSLGFGLEAADGAIYLAGALQGLWTSAFGKTGKVRLIAAVGGTLQSGYAEVNTDGTLTGVTHIVGGASSAFPVLILYRRTDGTAAAGMGAEVQTWLENASGTDKQAMVAQALWTDATNGTEDADYVLKLIAAGTLAERFRVSSTGDLTLTGYINQDSWTAMTLSNSWVDFGAGYQGAEYMKDRMGFVHLRGLVKNGSSGGAAITTLPSGYRPSAIELHASASNALFCLIEVTAAGVVTCTAGGDTTWISLNGLTFKAA